MTRGDGSRVRTAKEQFQLARAQWFEALFQAVAKDRTGTLTSTTFFIVYRLVYRYMNHENGAYPAVATVARDTGYNERTVREHLDRAVAAGFLLKRRDGRRKANLFVLNLGVLANPHEGVAGSQTIVARSAQAVDSVGRTTLSSADRETGKLSHTERLIGVQAPGAGRPTNQLVSNHQGEPRQTTSVRSTFGQSDELVRDDVIRRLTVEVYDHTHGLGRIRSRKSRIAAALRKLASQEVELDRAVRGTIAAMRGPDAYNPELGGHAAAEKILRERRWEEWIEDDLSASAPLWSEPDDDAAAFG